MGLLYYEGNIYFMKTKNLFNTVKLMMTIEELELQVKNGIKKFSEFNGDESYLYYDDKKVLLEEKDKWLEEKDKWVHCRRYPVVLDYLIDDIHHDIISYYDNNIIDGNNDIEFYVEEYTYYYDNHTNLDLFISFNCGDDSELICINPEFGKYIV